uniref:Secretion-regulating guanine nucleotide exchange factor n=1 Tax=Castor canadensis TaxID=51338 RepID=A0A8C0W509_CASCN
MTSVILGVSRESREEEATLQLSQMEEPFLFVALTKMGNWGLVTQKMFCILPPANLSLVVLSNRWPVAGILLLCSQLLREKIVCIAAGLRHALAATVSGIVFQWGTGLASSGRRLCPGQSLPLFLTAKEPSRVTGMENCKAVRVLAGSDHSASLTDAGELYVWGSNKHGQLATQAAFLPVPQRIEAHCFQNEKVTTVWSGWTHLVAQTGENAAENLGLVRVIGTKDFYW